MRKKAPTPKKRKQRAPRLERLVARETADTLSATTILAIRKIAEEIARDALAAPGFREGLRRLVSDRMRALVDDLTRNGRR